MGLEDFLRISDSTPDDIADINELLQGLIEKVHSEKVTVAIAELVAMAECLEELIYEMKKRPGPPDKTSFGLTAGIGLYKFVKRNEKVIKQLLSIDCNPTMFLDE